MGAEVIQFVRFSPPSAPAGYVRAARHAFLVNSLVAIGVFATVNGILAVRFMLGNPFAWVVLTLGLGLLLTATAIRAKHCKE